MAAANRGVRCKLDFMAPNSQKVVPYFVSWGSGNACYVCILYLSIVVPYASHMTQPCPLHWAKLSERFEWYSGAWLMIYSQAYLGLLYLHFILLFYLAFLTALMNNIFKSPTLKLYSYKVWAQILLYYSILMKFKLFTNVIFSSVVLPSFELNVRCQNCRFIFFP